MADSINRPGEFDPTIGPLEPIGGDPEPMSLVVTMAIGFVYVAAAVAAEAVILTMLIANTTSVFTYTN